MTHYTFTLTHGKATARVRVIDYYSLYGLADVLLEAIGFDLDHAFGFHSNLSNPYARNEVKEYTLFADQGEERLPSDTGVEETEVCDVFSEGETMLFHFDYGDDWMFHVTCTAIETTKSRKRKPEILSVEGTFPEQYPDYEEEWDEDEDGTPANVISISSAQQQNTEDNEQELKDELEQKLTEEYDEELEEEKQYERNAALVDRFAVYLLDKKVSQKTVNKHCSSILFYGNDYLVGYEGMDLAEDYSAISPFLDSWFIRKCMWANEKSIKEYITSFKKFYAWMDEAGELDEGDYKGLLQLIKEEKQGWIDRVKKYNDPDTNFEDVFPEHF